MRFQRGVGLDVGNHRGMLQFNGEGLLTAIFLEVRITILGGENLTTTRIQETNLSFYRDNSIAEAIRNEI